MLTDIMNKQDQVDEQIARIDQLVESLQHEKAAKALASNMSTVVPVQTDLTAAPRHWGDSVPRQSTAVCR